MLRLLLAVFWALATAAATFVPLTLPFVALDVPVSPTVEPLWQGGPFYFGLFEGTLQGAFPLLAGFLLGPRLGPLSQLIFLALGLGFFPLFAQGGGWAYLQEPSAGFLLAFPLAALVVGHLAWRYRKSGVLSLFFITLLGWAVLNAVGVAVAMVRLGTPGLVAQAYLLWPLLAQLLASTLISLIAWPLFQIPNQWVATQKNKRTRKRRPSPPGGGGTPRPSSRKPRIRSAGD